MLNKIPLIGKGLSVGLTSALTLLLTAPAQATPAAPASAINDPSPGWDYVWHKVLVDIWLIGILFSIVTLYFMFKYRRRNENEEGNPPKMTSTLAMGWTVIPIFLIMADDFFLAAQGWDLWNAYRQVPAERMEIQMESGMYSWDYTYPNGVETQNELIVPAGTPIMLRMTSRDTLHSHFIPDFRVKEDSMPGRITYLWFYPEKPGEHQVTCAEYCGIMHSYMVGKVIVKSEEDFNQWYHQEAAKLAQAKTEATKKEEA
jgi:cytochrome c oxidase subunit II